MTDVTVTLNNLLIINNDIIRNLLNVIIILRLLITISAMYFLNRNFLFMIISRIFVTLINVTISSFIIYDVMFL